MFLTELKTTIIKNSKHILSTWQKFIFKNPLFSRVTLVAEQIPLLSLIGNFATKGTFQE